MAQKDVIEIENKETGEPGNVRDYRLALAKEKTTVAATDAIELRTVDDKQIFVKADSFFNAMAAFFKANNKSTITSLFGELTENNVSSPGSINMANLASVLSGYFGNTKKVASSLTCTIYMGGWAMVSGGIMAYSANENAMIAAYDNENDSICMSAAIINGNVIPLVKATNNTLYIQVYTGQYRFYYLGTTEKTIRYVLFH